MARQISFDDILPSAFKQLVVGFANQQFQVAQDEDTLPDIKNRHEAYGILAESFVLLKGAADSIKGAVADALSALPASDEAFNEAADIAYSGCISTAQAAIHMAVQAQNISLQLIERRRVEPLPLLEGLEDDMSEIPDVYIDDEEDEDDGK